MIAVPVPGPDPRGEPVPGADGLLLEPAPVQLHQVERGEEVLVEAVGGVEHALLGEGLAVLPEHVLHEGRAGLGGTHVDQDPAGADRLRARVAHRSRSFGCACRPAAQAGVEHEVEHVLETRMGRPALEPRDEPVQVVRAQGSRRRAGPRRAGAARSRAQSWNGSGTVSGDAGTPPPASASPPTSRPQHRLAPGDVRPDPEHRVDPADHVDRLGAQVPPARDQGPGAAAGRATGRPRGPRRRCGRPGPGPAWRRPRAPEPGPTRLAHCRARVGQVRGGRQRRGGPTSAARSRASAPARRAARGPTRPAPATRRSGAATSSTRGERPPSAWPAAPSARRTAEAVTGAPVTTKAGVRVSGHRRSEVGARRGGLAVGGEQQVGEGADAEPDQLLLGYVGRVDRRRTEAAGPRRGRPRERLLREAAARDRTGPGPRRRPS